MVVNASDEIASRDQILQPQSSVSQHGLRDHHITADFHKEVSGTEDITDTCTSSAGVRQNRQ